MTNTEELMQRSLHDEDYDEEWKVILNTKGEYTLSKNQAIVLKQAIATGSRGIVLFQTFSISIPYITEFYRVKRFKKGQIKLSASASEPEYVPIPPERWEKIRKEIYGKIGKPMK